MDHAARTYRAPADQARVGQAHTGRKAFIPAVPYKAYAALLAGGMGISWAAIFVRLTTAPPAVTAFYRLAFASTLTWLLMAAERGWGAWRHRAGQPHPQPHPASARPAFPGWRAVFWAVGSGLLLALHFVLWFASLRLTSVASSVVLVTMQPLFVFAGSYVWLREGPRPGQLLWGAVALAGGILVGWGDFRLAGTAMQGDILAFAAAAMVAGYWLVGRNLRRNLGVLPYTAWVYTAAALCLLVYASAAGQPLLGYPAADWWLFLGLAVVPTLLGHTLFNWSLRYVSAGTVSVSVLVEPLGATLLGWLILDEAPSALQLWGGALLLAGLVQFQRAQDP